jgi:hypothetical protein
MCCTIKTNEIEGKIKVPVLIRRNMVVVAFFAFLVFVLILATPIIQQTHILVKIAQNKIEDVWVEKPLVSLVSTFVRPPERIGINTINVTIPQTGESFELIDVPDGEYTIVWVSNGVPETGVYTIEVKLIQNDVIIDTFSLEVSF